MRGKKEIDRFKKTIMSCRNEFENEEIDRCRDGRIYRSYQ